MPTPDRIPFFLDDEEHVLAALFMLGRRAARDGHPSQASGEVSSDIARRAWLAGWDHYHHDQAIDVDPPCKWCHGRGCIHCG